MMYTTTEAADLLGKQYYQLTYLLKTHRALDVPQFNCRRLFTPDDILVLAKAFHLPDDKIVALASFFSEAARTD
jgi:hypothetical protein